MDSRSLTSSRLRRAKLKQAAVAEDLDYRAARSLDRALFNRLLTGPRIQDILDMGGFKRCIFHVNGSVIPRTPSLPLDRGGWLAGDVIEDTVDTAHFVDDAVGDFAEQGIGLGVGFPTSLEKWMGATANPRRSQRCAKLKKFKGQKRWKSIFLQC